MPKERIKILEKNVRSLKYQLDELEEMLDAAKVTLKEAYAEDNSSLSEEDAIRMVEDSL